MAPHSGGPAGAAGDVCSAATYSNRVLKSKFLMDDGCGVEKCGHVLEMPFFSTSEASLPSLLCLPDKP